MKENDFFLPPKKKNGDVVLFMFLFFLLLPGFSIAQYKAQLNIDIKNGTLVNVFENIQKQSAYRFMYSNQDVAAIKKHLRAERRRICTRNFGYCFKRT